MTPENHDTKSTNRIVKSFRDRIYLYSLELIYCRKPNCRSCPHGPYWYARWRVGKRTFCKYIGKELRLIEAKKNQDQKVSTPDPLTEQQP